MTDYDIAPTAETSGAGRGSRSTADTIGPITDAYGSPNAAAPAATAPASHADDPLDQPAVAEPKKKSGTNAVREIVETLLLAVVIFFAVRALVLNFRVDGNSMLPNLSNQEMLLVNRNIYFHFDLNRVLNVLPGDDRASDRIVYPFHPPERGDIVVFNPPNGSDKPYIKRVIGLPGEEIRIRDGSVFVDGEELDEPYISTGITECNGTECTWIVPDGHVFVLGDNRRNSSDSRSIGFVDVDSIIGKAWLSYWPFDEFGLVPHYDYPEISDR